MSSAAANHAAPPTTDRGPWLSVIAIALGAFALVVTEFLPVGMLPQLSSTLHVSEGTAGLTVTATALLGAITAPAAPVLVGHTDRRFVLLVFTALLIASSGLSIFADNFAVLIVARVILGIGIGGFWAISITAAAGLVPEDSVPTASTLVFGGISLGSVISVPAGSWIAAHYDWHDAFTAASVLAVVVFLVQLVLLPAMPMKEGVNLGRLFGLLREPRIRVILLTVVCIVGGHYAGYTFLTPYLDQISGFGSGARSVLLLIYGVVAVIGTFSGGYLAARGLHRMVFATVATFAVSLIVMALLGSNPVVAVIALIVWALCLGLAPVGTQLWLYHASRHAPEAAQSMNTSVFQLSITFGSLLGSLAVDLVSLHSTMWLGGIILVAGVGMVITVGRINRRAGDSADVTDELVPSLNA